MAHAVVNGANGSLTWCSGLGCPRCDADRELNERIRCGELVTWCQGPPLCVNCTQGARACPRVGAPLGQMRVQPQPAIRLGGDALPPWGYQIVAGPLIPQTIC